MAKEWAEGGDRRHVSGDTTTKKIKQNTKHGGKKVSFICAQKHTGKREKDKSVEKKETADKTSKQKRERKKERKNEKGNSEEKKK